VRDDGQDREAAEAEGSRRQGPRLEDAGKEGAMSMATHVIGFKPPDEKWRKMKAIWDACMAARVDPPKEVDEFFGGEPPDDSGVEVDERKLIECGAIREWKEEMRSGFEVDVSKIPDDVAVIRCHNSYLLGGKERAMEVPAMRLTEDVQPTYAIELFRDPNENWFGRVTVHSGSGRSILYTATYSSAWEALLAAWAKAYPARKEVGGG
jgi:hypothetical protein